MVNRLASRCQFFRNLKKKGLDFLLFCATVAERFVTNDFPALTIGLKRVMHCCQFWDEKKEVLFLQFVTNGHFFKD